MRAGDTEYLAEQMPELQARTAEADKEYRRCLEALPPEERAASERKLKKLLALDEEAARKEDVVKVPSNRTWLTEMLRLLPSLALKNTLVSGRSSASRQEEDGQASQGVLGPEFAS